MNYKDWTKLSGFLVFVLVGCSDSSSSSVENSIEPGTENPATPINVPGEGTENPGTGTASTPETVTDGDDASTPNILFIISDDQGLDASAQYTVSQDIPNTPVINALAQRGIVFDNAWATPSCTTTRGSIISGQHGVNSGVTTTPSLMDTNTLTLQRFLGNSTSVNYATAVIGKWHLAGGNTQGQLTHPNEAGVDYYAGNISGTLDNYSNWPLNINGTESDSNTYHTTEVTDLAIDWIAQQNSAWFLWLAYVSPHSPFHLPPDNLHTQTLSGTQNDIQNNPRAYYLAAIEAMDTEIGRLLDSIPTDMLDNTLIVFLGDNGTPRAVIDTDAYARSHGKSSLYEGGIRVPMVVAGKGVSRFNQRESALVNSTDLFPSVVEAVGLSTPSQLDGQSFLALLSDANAASREFNYSEFVDVSADGWTVRNDEFKLIVYADGNRELYNLVTDPQEVNNLISQAQQYSEEITALEAFGASVRNKENVNQTVGAIDISNATLVNQSLDCTDYVNTYTSSVIDVINNANYNGDFEISVEGNQCVFNSNAIPNHDFNDGSRDFPNSVSAQSDQYRVPVSPQLAPTTTALSLQVDNAIMLNGVKVDILAAGCFGVGNGRIGCNDPAQPWRYDPMSPAAGFNVDSHNAHTQPDGTYHYHGEPNALFSSTELIVSPVVGFAADGFAIYGSFIDDNGTIRKVQSSYRLKSGARPSGDGQPVGNYDGTFRDDYEFVAGLGDLDECNGMLLDGNYRYYITDEYPYILGCFSGTPDESFFK